MLRILSALAVIAFLSSCASQIMQSYVGKDIQEAILDYGPPSHEMDMPDGTRAFQWSMSGSAVFTGTTYGAISTGVMSSTPCVYTAFGKKNAAGSYTITGFRQPRWDCE
jgi:hypothetical protein